MKVGGIIYDATKSTWRQNGYEHPMTNLSIQAKHKKSCLTNHGAATPFQMHHVRKRLRDQDVIERKLATYTANQTFKNSKPEQRFYELLLQRFEHDDIIRQRHVKGTLWPIDFYVKSIDTWFQIDGVYWHGLDGQLEQHRTKVHVSKRSAMIVHKWETDRKQDAWFAEHNMRLIRVTDKQVIQTNDVQSLLDVSQGPSASSQ